MPGHNTTTVAWQFKVFKKAEGSDGCSSETLLAPCTRKKRLQRKMTKGGFPVMAESTRKLAASTR